MLIFLVTVKPTAWPRVPFLYLGLSAEGRTRTSFFSLHELRFNEIRMRMRR